MGISGLLPALKSIQVTKHLSEYSGQTIAVDAYVWLHKGVYSCATELATGRNTHKYVDYAMHRVRLMRHHKIEPYIVFDGGPLPAKKGTEIERKQKRDKNLAQGNALAAQGKHSQARDCYIKCIDVTPEMAFQFIKALRAESVAYVVAPYEADAQLAYLERIGLVDGILTEDSDLLVFGCRSVLFKLDVVASTVVSISRKDFGSVMTSASDTNGISLLGWSDVDFRAMAILSGCDYLPSIPGIGLKTACTLLRKWKSAEQVVKAIMLEGKKSVPPGYWNQYKLAEKCFLHQRVYCPKREKLVYLTDVDDDWDQEAEAYVGRYAFCCVKIKRFKGILVTCLQISRRKSRWEMRTLPPNYL
ncbi:PIN domain-like protein [Crassisporium funariophilum]|nr:PIN domain-like protein [Crassisporium funariophilum]